jgi:scyllo-inositol 2-dehydrogenase (NADP+)
MRVVIVGMGVQGHKRKAVAGGDCVACVDPVSDAADFRDVSDVPLSAYDAALVCTPDAPKPALLTYLAENGKSALVEKPLVAGNAELSALEALAMEKGAVIYTAYNHRFEPHFVRLRDLIQGRELGELYSCRLFYGNGTARLVRDSAWRDQGAGVLPDLGSHMLDLMAFWFGSTDERFTVATANRFENRAPDHVVLVNEAMRPRIEIELTLVMWRNHFTCDLLAEKGSAHIESLCKWGPSRFTRRTRVFPSGRPIEESVTLVQDDPTWAAEYDHFRNLVASGQPLSLGRDIRLNRMLGALGRDAVKKVEAGHD